MRVSTELGLKIEREEVPAKSGGVRTAIVQVYVGLKASA